MTRRGNALPSLIECLCPCHHGRGDSGSGYSYVWDDDREIRHEDWISCGCESKDPAVCTKERPDG